MRLFCLLLLFPTLANSQKAKPTLQQLAWHKLGYYWFIHFGPNTFTDVEWGNGKENEEVFNPQKLDCNQWCRIAKEAGASQIIITAKHHDGFCLWPSKFSTHTVAQSKWRNGKGDVLKELSSACKKYGLKFGVYISPWDRNHPDYGTEKYNDVFVNMMKELFTNYGPINELWWDGANGEGPNGKKQVYNWKRFKETVRKLSPNTVIFSDVGPDIRWCGNESGIAGETNFNYLNADGFEPGEKAPPTDTLNRGNENGNYYIPAECDVSIRPGWFYHKAEDDNVKAPEQLFQIYLKSVGRGANLLLNIPPTPDGLIHKNDSAAVMGFKKLRDESFAADLLKGIQPALEKVTTGGSCINCPAEYRIQKLQATDAAVISFSFSKPTPVNTVVLKELLDNGQKIKLVNVSVYEEGKTYASTYKNIKTVGNKKICLLPKTVTAKEIRIIILPGNAEAGAALLKPEAYFIAETLTGR